MNIYQTIIKVNAKKSASKKKSNDPTTKKQEIKDNALTIGLFFSFITSNAIYNNKIDK